MKPGPGLVTVIALLIPLPVLCAQGDETPLTPAQAKELEIWAGQLKDPETSPKTKRDAAALLLDRPYPQATRVLLDLLAAEDAQDAKNAICEAMAAAGVARKGFIEPLMAMLTGKDASGRAAAAKALLPYKNHGVTERLITVMRDASHDRAVRLQTMGILQRVLEKRVVGALVSLLGDSDPGISKAAHETLSNLTHVVLSPEQWRQRWQKIKDRPLSEWLREMAENIAEHSRHLAEQNAKLRSRLAKAMEDLYAATPPERRDAMLIGLLQDPIADVKLVGISLISASVASAAKVEPAAIEEARKLLSDKDLRVRISAAALAGSAADAKAVAPLLERLAVEEDPEARRVVLTSLGQLQEPSAVPAVLKEIVSEEDKVAAAAAIALERIAAKHSPAGKTNGKAAEAILGRYASARTAERSDDVVALLEALLRAMGALGRKEFVPVVKEALKDKAAMIRLAAVNSLGQLGDDASASAVVPLLGDADRGVRQAAIVVLGKLGGVSYVESIIDRTRVSSEPDAAVRQQAGEVAIRILQQAETQQLWNVAGQLQNRNGGKELQILILEMLVDRLEAEKGDHLHAAHRQLGLALKLAGRPSEALTHLRRALELLEQANSPQVRIVWHEWLDALYDHDVEAFVKAVAEQEDEELFAKAYVDLAARLERLKDDRQWSRLITLTANVREHLAPRLTVEQLRVLKKLLDEAEQQRRLAEERQVRKLAAELLASDAATRSRASAAIKSMGSQAVRPLLKEFKEAITADEPNPAAEKAFVAILAEVAPKLTGYDSEAKKEDRVKLIDKWIESIP
ncbi:MAG: HEAT repeat domain-containing protein [Planctomycetota bacterium]|jgi:HEAT repeat protein